MAYYHPVDNLNNQGFVSTLHLGKRKLVHGGVEDVDQSLNASYLGCPVGTWDQR